jgi:hypothetical protein
MPRITISDSFLASLADLDPADAKRVALFLDKLVRAPEASSLRPEIVHDAADRAVRSLKVTHDLRAISHVEGERVLLLFVARHDRAYAWARDKCVACIAATGEFELRSAPDEAGVHLVVHACPTAGALCELLSSAGIAHGLRP